MTTRDSGALVRSRDRRAVRFIALLASGLLLGACVVSTRPSNTLTTQSPRSSTTPSAATTRSPDPLSPAPSADGPPPLNRLEVKVIDALAKLGVTGQRAELPFNNAAIYADFGAGSQLFVNAAPTGTGRGEFTVIDERQLAEVRVQRVQYASGPPPRYRFECSADTYEVSGAVPPGFPDLDAFVSGFIRALGCGA